MVTRVIRILVYEGAKEAVRAQLGKSMPDGVHQGMHGSTIRALTVPPSLELLLHNIARWMQWEQVEETDLISEVSEPDDYLS